MFDDPLSLPVRGAVTISVLVFVLHVARLLRRSGPLDAPARALAAYGVVVLALATALSHLDAARPTLMTLFPPGAALGIAGALWSVASPSLRARFASFDDAGVRGLLAYRALFGALLLAMAALGHLPRSFALSAGLGDLAVGWLALSAPVSLAADAREPASRRWRLLVHGVGLVDVLQVLVLAVTVVRPWSIAHGSATTSMTLPWVFVPFMFAMNLHGIVQVLAFQPSAETASTEPRRDGSEPPRGVRSAAS